MWVIKVIIIESNVGITDLYSFKNCQKEIFSRNILKNENMFCNFVTKLCFIKLFKK